MGTLTETAGRDRAVDIVATATLQKTPFADGVEVATRRRRMIVTEFSKAAHIDAPPDQVWRTLADLEAVGSVEEA